MFDSYQDIMGVLDAAEALGVGKNRIYELLGNSELKGFRLGHTWKIPKTNLEAYVLNKSGGR